MNWGQKSTMCKHLNAEEYDKALDIVIENFESMDEQAWDMFFHGIELTKESIKPLIDKHKIICDKSINRKSGSFRMALRMTVYEKIVNEIKNEKEKN